MQINPRKESRCCLFLTYIRYLTYWSVAVEITDKNDASNLQVLLPPSKVQVFVRVAVKAVSLELKNFENIESAKLEISKLYSEITRLKVELQVKSADEVRVARELCMLRTRLLEDGQLKYLERN
eukprot:TsM_000246000 transcript=TsM_000246000 gene=TsM_000246000